MKNAGISQRIKVLTSTLLAAIVVGGAVSFLSVLQLRSSVHELAGTTIEKRIAMDALEDVLEARLAALKHRISPNEATEEAVLENTGEVVKELDALTAMLPEDDPQLQAVDQVRASIADYSATFERMTDLQAHRNEIFPNLTESGIEARRNLTEVIAGAYSAGNIDAVHRAGIAQEKLLLARFYGERFLLTNEAETLDRARLELEATSAAVADLVAVVREPALRTEARDAAKQVAAYAGFLQEMADTIFARNELNARLDTVGPATLAQVEGVLDEIGEHQTTIRDAAASMVYWTLVAIGTITGISVMVGIAGLLSSLNFRRTFEAQLEGSLTTMSELANGNLEVEIDGTENETEFGRIARSLTLFRDKGLEARKLAEDAKAQEVAQQKRAAEDAERRRIEEEEAAKHIEAERRKTLAELSASIGQVVRAAVDGDFSQRIEDVFKDPEIQEMAAMINRMAENVENGVNDTAAVMSGLANGDLTLGMSGSHRGKFAELAQSVNEMREKLSQLVERISEQCRDVALAAQSMSGQSNELQGRVEQQAASLEETAAAMEEISATVKSSAENSSIASQYAGATAKKAAESGHVVENAVAAMGDISEASSKIEDIVAVIDGISFQTSLLALNAGVEAARAGESGRGFAVVASEVRALALRSSEASKDIQALISLSSERIEKGVQLVEATGRTLVEVVGEVEDMSSKLDGLKAAANEQSVGVSEVSGAINQLDGITQENARLADLGNQSSKDVTSQANAMLQLLAFFKTSEDAVAQARLAG